MKYRPLGETGLTVSEVSFGAGPVSGLMTDGSFVERRAVIERALQLGINWFDTAAGYGAGKSEAHLGEVLADLKPDAQPIHLATKVRLLIDGETDLRPIVIKSVRESLSRLRVSQVTLLQVHNSITPRRGMEPTSITPEDVLGSHGILAAMEDLRSEGCVQHFGLTGIGDADSLRLVMQSRRFATIQAPLHLLNPSALVNSAYCFREPDYGGFLREAAKLGMGIFAIRAYAAGALLCASPSAHTLRTPFFPLELYERDHQRATRLSHLLGSEVALRELALRFVLSQPEISSAILGFGRPEHLDEALRISRLGPLSKSETERIDSLLKTIVVET